MKLGVVGDVNLFEKCKYAFCLDKEKTHWWVYGNDIDLFNTRELSGDIKK